MIPISESLGDGFPIRHVSQHGKPRQTSVLHRQLAKNLHYTNNRTSDGARAWLGLAPLWQAVDMATKRTKADKAQRQANQLEKRADTREQTPKKRKPREDFSQAAVRSNRKLLNSK